MVARVASIFALILTVLTAPWVLWLYFPAPTIELWTVAALLSEFSLLLAAAALLVTGLSIAALSALAGRLRASALPWLTGGAGLLMFAFALLPTPNAYRAAQEQGTRLLLAGYFAGLSISTDRQPSTETYLIAENKTLQLDIWQPTDALEGARPAALMVHGGSWASGGRSETPRWNSWLNEQGVVVVDIDYRLTPPARWRGATGDVKCAVVWTKRHAARLGIDPTKIVLMGNSAGAHLALLAAYTAGDAR